MLIDLFKRLRFAPIESYQYIGFGSVAFVDFRMVHRLLGIKELISIEDPVDKDEQLRFENNSPYSGLKLLFGHSSSILPKIDFNKRSLVWLDYDGSLSRSMANDIATVARTVSSGSFIGITFTTAFPTQSPARDRELRRLRDDFPNLIAEDTKAKAFDGVKFAEFGRSALSGLLEKALEDADAGLAYPERRRVAKQVCFFKYKDGIPMVTIGWMIVSKAEEPIFNECKLEALPFHKSGTSPFRINIPLVTPFEVREMEKRLPNLGTCTDLDWIPEQERKSFDGIYRYLPHFSVVEQV